MLALYVMAHDVPDECLLLFLTYLLLCIIIINIFMHRYFQTINLIYKSFMLYNLLSYDVASGSEITPCNKIDKPLVVYRFTGKVMTLRT